MELVHDVERGGTVYTVTLVGDEGREFGISGTKRELAKLFDEMREKVDRLQ